MSDFSDLKKLAIKLRVASTKIPAETNRIVKEVCSNVQRTLVMATPVDTGHARANWQASIGQPTNQPVKEFDKQGGQTIIKNNAIIQKRLPTQDVWINNNVRYIGFLNDGWSKQAPAGFVQLSIQVAISTIKDAKIEIM